MHGNIGEKRVRLSLNFWMWNMSNIRGTLHFVHWQVHWMMTVQNRDKKTCKLHVAQKW